MEVVEVEKIVELEQIVEVVAKQVKAVGQIVEVEAEVVEVELQGEVDGVAGRGIVVAVAVAAKEQENAKQESHEARVAKFEPVYL